MKDKNGIEYEECIVGNIIGNHYWGKEKIIRNGTRHFRGGTKVYCLFIYGGNGDQSIRVLGKPRKSFRMVDVVICAFYIKNFRLQKVYEPRIIDFINKYPNAASAAEIMKWRCKELNEGNREIKE